jgi:NADH-quinone oxidoreductase subunit N
MFFTRATGDTPRVVAPGILSKVAIAVCAVVTVVLGIFPQPLLDLADHAHSCCTESAARRRRPRTRE